MEFKELVRFPSLIFFSPYRGCDKHNKPYMIIAIYLSLNINIFAVYVCRNLYDRGFTDIIIQSLKYHFKRN